MDQPVAPANKSLNHKKVNYHKTKGKMPKKAIKLNLKCSPKTFKKFS